VSRTAVAVIGGGADAEHDVSLASARAIAGALDPDRYDVVEVTIGSDGGWRYTDGAPIDDDLAGAIRVLGRVDVVIPALHGRHGEDGTIAGLLELVGVPYVGSGVGAGAIAMDKHATKLVARSLGIAVADGIRLSGENDPRLDQVALPAVVKPNRGGSSFGVSLVEDRSDLAGAVRLALAFDENAIIERFVAGREIDIAVLEDTTGVLRCGAALEIVRPAGTVFTTADKYESDPDFRVPAPLDTPDRRALEEAAIALFTALGCRGVARIDFFLGPDGPVLSEVNTFPGFTARSQVPRMFGAIGMPYRTLIDCLIATALTRSHGHRIRRR
jgi:D-alanine-D-alanine ligase